jgi:ubiquinone biosynthesis accessory factor UbiK
MHQQNIPHGNFIEDLAKCLSGATKRIRDAIPTEVKETQKDLEKTFHIMLQNAFAKLDLVTREEFDVQAGVLAKTRHKLQMLEKRIAELEPHKHSSSQSVKKHKKTEDAKK